MNWSKAFAVVLVAGVAGCGGPGGQSGPGSSGAPGAPVGTPATVQRITPILAVDAIEPSLPFWEALGFTVNSPTWVDDKLIFAGLSKDGLDIHYQTKAHIEGNIPEAADVLGNTTALVYITVDSLDAIMAGLGDAEVVIPRRRTSWGSDEVYVREPGGNLVAFAAYGR